MIERYSRPEMAQIWSLENQYQSWLEVEILTVEAWSRYGEIPRQDADKIRRQAHFSVERILQLEQETKHDVVAFTRAVSESLGTERKWVHFGLTSTDVVDTAQGLRLKQANDVLRDDLEQLKATLATLALRYQNTVMIGRTHGVHAEPTTFGLVIATWYAEILRQLERFEHAARGVEAGKLSGAVGTFANIPPEVEADVMAHLGLTAEPISTQVLPRDLHAEYLSTLALIATSIERFALEIRHLQRTEIREVEEGFAKGQKGSSAMPHKRNPIGSENLTGIARVIRGYQIPAQEDVGLWHERDISHSSVERIILPDATTLLDYQLTRFNHLLEQLQVFPDRMLKNLNLTHGLIFSQRLLLKLIEAGLSREQAYDLVQPLAMAAWETQGDFEQTIRHHSTITHYLSSQDLDEAFDYRWHLRQIPAIFARLGLSSSPQ